jgi:hypothetical protein
MEIFFPCRCCKRGSDASRSCKSWARLSSWLPCGVAARWFRAARYQRRAKPCICKEGVISPRPSSYARYDFIIKTILIVSSMVSLRVHRRPKNLKPRHAVLDVLQCYLISSPAVALWRRIWMLRRSWVGVAGSSEHSLWLRRPINLTVQRQM